MAVNPIRPPKGAVKRKKIVGRGDSAGKGSTCGRGHKGQNSRSGGGVRPGFEGGQMPLYRRVARRGFSNYPFKQQYTPVNVEELELRFSDGDAVNLETLREKKIIKKSVELVKILGNGSVTKKLTIDGLKISKSAKEMIEKAGGTVSEPVGQEPQENEAKPVEKDTKNKEGQG